MRANKQQILSASLLISQLTDEDAEKRRAAVSQLKVIAKALGSSRVKTELIPHLKEQVANDDDSQVIMTFVESVHSLGEIMGGGPEYTHLFPILEEVMQHEEQSVRNKAVQIYEQIIRCANVQKCETKIIISLKNILNFDYNDGKQGLAVVASKMLGDFSYQNQQFLLNQYQALAQSPVMILRRFAAINSKYLVEWLADFEAPILKIVELLFKDKEDSNKIYLIDTIINLSKFKNQGFLQAYFNLISYQFPWRVRYELISKVDKLAQVLGSPQKLKPFLSYMIKYINDVQPQIRSISCLKLKQIVPYLQSDDIINKIIPALKTIPQDNHAYIRNSLAKSLPSLSLPLGKKNTSQHVLPYFLQLLKDEEIEVKLTIFNGLGDICNILGVELLVEAIAPVISQLSRHVKWRIRIASIDFLFYLIHMSGKMFMTDEIIKQVMDYIRDRVNAVRKEGVKLLSKIQLQFGTEWFQKNLMPKVLEISRATNYMSREIFLEAVQILCPYLSYEYMSKNISSILYNCYIDDHVENVRITLCSTLRSIYDSCPKDKDIIKKSLRALSNDRSKDVRELASKLLKQIS